MLGVRERSRVIDIRGKTGVIAILSQGEVDRDLPIACASWDTSQVVITRPY